MKKGIAFILALGIGLSLGACSGAFEQPPGSQAQSLVESENVTITDSQGTSAQLPINPRVVCLYGSYADAWLLAGGELVGVTQDAVDERGLDVGDAQIVGTVKEPNAETIIALEPQLVLLSSDVAAQQDMLGVLEGAGLTCLSFRVDTFDDYAKMMEEFCKATGRQENLEQAVEKPLAQIEAARSQYSFTEDPPRVLLMRAFSTGIKAKTDDELAGAILKDLGCINIADSQTSMLEDLSLEEVISADPDFIFVTTMGDEKKALEYLDSQIMENPAWSQLSAVKEGRYAVLPKDLFHYKPNARWGESYAYLGGLLQAWDQRDA